MNSDSRRASYGSSTSTAITPPIDAGTEKLEVRKIRSTSLAEVLTQTKKKGAALRPSGMVRVVCKYYLLDNTNRSAF
jgi:hypothetical protein